MLGDAVTEQNNSRSRIFAVARAFAVVFGAFIMFAAPGVAKAADSENSIIVSVQDQANMFLRDLKTNGLNI